MVEHENGWETEMGVFPGSWFVRVHTSVRNEGEEPYVVASEEVLEFEVDLGLAVERLKSFGTGFLQEVDAAPGSFSFTAVVDPQTRNGVVAAAKSVRIRWSFLTGRALRGGWLSAGRSTRTSDTG